MSACEESGRDGGHCSRVSSAPARTPHMPPAGPVWIQPLRELDRWAAVLEKMGLLGRPFSGAEGHSTAVKSLLPCGKKDR